MKLTLWVLVVLMLVTIPCGWSQHVARDLYSDTWVATDALGRTMPSHNETGLPKIDRERVVGIFYITWHTQGLAQGDGQYGADVTKILAADPETRRQWDNPLWKGSSFHWGEPEMGYFLSQDEWVIRKDMSMLADAGVDVLVMDVTNAVRYWNEWDVTFKTMQQMKAEGNKVPQFCFWAFNGPVITVVQDLYEKIYKEGKYRDLWFHWDGKPLLLWNGTPTFDANQGGLKHPNPNYRPAAKTDPNDPNYGDPDYCEEFYLDYTKEVKDFFTTRTMWWGYYEWGGKRFIGTEDNWSFGYSMADKRLQAMDATELLSTHQGEREQAAVTPAQHPVPMVAGDKIGVGKSWSRQRGQPELDERDMPLPTYVTWLGETVNSPTHYGIYFQERWDEALQADPKFLYINDWNEWTAGKYQPPNGGTFPFLRRDNSFYFVDQYNAEFNRCIHPMRGGYTDNYYMQMAQNIRKYKGVRQIPSSRGIKTLPLGGDWVQWDAVEPEYRDTRGDVTHRDAKGYGGLHYTNTSGRNDIVTSKVAVSELNVSFFVETVEPLTPYDDKNGDKNNSKNWMLLFIDSDNNSATGWYGYDYVVNYSARGGVMTTIHSLTATGTATEVLWTHIADVPFAVSDNKMQIDVPRALLGLTEPSFTLDFKWSDDAASFDDPISFCLHGDTAPNRRFNYRYQWSE